MNETLVSSKKIKELKEAASAYEAALEYDYCPDNEYYNEDYWGSRPDEIAKDIINIINKL